MTKMETEQNNGGIHSIKEWKKVERERAKQKRATVPLAIQKSAGVSAAKNFLAAIPLQPGSIISIYWPLKNEFDSRPLLNILHHNGYKIALPAVFRQDRTLRFRVWAPGDRMTIGSFGVSEPLESALEITPNIVITPLLAFTAQGFRLGYGGGYYDRTLRALRQSIKGLLAVGLAYSDQIMDVLPYDSYDERLDWLVSECGAQSFKHKNTGLSAG